MGSVAGLLIASGTENGLGAPMALAVIEGRPVVERGIRTLLDAGCLPVIVVLGVGVPEVRGGADLSGSVPIIDDQWRTGTGSSVRMGLATLSPTLVDAVIVLPVDMHGVTAEVVRRLSVDATAESLVAASYQGYLGHPVLLGRRHWAGITGRAVGEFNVRPYLRAHAEDLHIRACDDIVEGDDLDALAGLPGVRQF